MEVGLRVYAIRKIRFACQCLDRDCPLCSHVPRHFIHASTADCGSDLFGVAEWRGNPGLASQGEAPQMKYAFTPLLVRGTGGGGGA